MAGIKDIAKAAGVSPATVSNALNGRPNISASMRARILALCEEQHYQPNPASQCLKNGRSRTILFVFSDFDRQFYLQIIKGVSEYAYSRGYDLLICSARSCAKFMHRSFTCGCILLDRRVPDQLILQKASEDYPILLLDRNLDCTGVKSVLLDNYSVMRELAEGLFQRGYRAFAYLAGVETTQDNKERFAAVMDVLASHNIALPNEFHLCGDYTEKSGYQAARILMLSKRLPEVVICANDDMAFGMIRAFQENGLRVPGDISVTGFDDEKPAESLGLTTIAVPNYERGYLAAQYLFGCIDKTCDYSPVSIRANTVWRSGTTARQ